MNTIKFEEKKAVRMVAHRGVSGLERENTCAAFVAAGVKTYYGIETDVHVTADGKYIIVHDDNIKRVSGIDAVVEESTFDDLRAVRLYDTNGMRRGDLCLPTLSEYLQICKKYDKVAVLELKNDMTEEAVCGIAQEVTDCGMFDLTVFISFYPNNMRFLKKHFPAATAQFLSDKTSEEVVDFILENGLDADIHYAAVDRAFVERMHANGRTVNVWTVDRVEDAERMRDCGVDMITSNILE